MTITALRLVLRRAATRDSYTKWNDQFLNAFVLGFILLVVACASGPNHLVVSE